MGQAVGLTLISGGTATGAAFPELRVTCAEKAGTLEKMTLGETSTCQAKKGRGGPAGKAQSVLYHSPTQTYLGNSLMMGVGP